MNFSQIKHKLLILLMLGFMMPIFQGCSLLKIASQPFKNTVSKVPESTQKSERKIVCKGEITLDEQGRVTKCGNNYYSYEKTFNQEERRLSFRENISQFILNAQGYVLWFIIIAVVLSLSGFGWVVSGFFSVLRGTGRVARDLVKGIQSGKKYVRQNGVVYSKEEREIYMKGAQDILDRIGGSQTKGTKKIVGNLKAELED